MRFCSISICESFCSNGTLAVPWLRPRLGQDKYPVWDLGGKARGTFGSIGPAKSTVRRLARK
jgi:hypothetical protein